MSDPELVTLEDLSSFTNDEILRLVHDWSLWARPEQLAPDNPSSANYREGQTELWEIWLALAGRGWGKTRSGAEQVLHWVDNGYRRIGIIAPTSADARDVVTEGEALALDTPIPTPEGWTTIGEIQPGDELYAPDGSITHVVAKSPIWRDRPCYALKAHLANAIIADENHIWVTQTKNDRRQKYSPSEKTTEEIANTLIRTNGLNHSIALPSPILSHSTPLPIPPYTLGAWLGDGDTRGHGALCQHTDDISTIERIREDGFEVVKWRGKYSWGIHGLSTLLKNHGLDYNKHIPQAYLRASVSDRIALLQGLMDTDGNVSLSKGQCQFSNTNLRIVEGLRELLLTLGFKPGNIQVRPQSRSKLATKDGYRISFRRLPGLPCPFHMPRKAERTIRKVAKEAAYRLIESAEFVGVRDTICIQVDHLSGMFLVGKDFIPTHNSGIMTVAHPRKRPMYEPSKRRLTFPNGAIATLFSAEEPERLRGPQFDAIWMDEIAGWQYPQEAWDMAMFCLRLGIHPQVMISTTPKPIPLIRKLMERAKKEPNKIILTSGSTYENRANLASAFFGQVAQYEGTRLGRQELHAELIDPKENGIVKSPWFKLFPANMPFPPFEHILQSYDTAFTEKTVNKKTSEPDPSACSTWGTFSMTAALRLKLKVPDHIRYGTVLLDCWDDWLGFPELRAKVKTEWDTSYYGPKGESRRADTVLIEAKGSGISLRQELQNVVPAHPFNPGRADKFERLHEVSNVPCQGMVFIPESKKNPGKFISWSDKLIDQVCSFPLVEHDDYVDTFSQAMKYLKDQGYLVADILEKEEEYADTTQRPVNPYAQ